MDSRASAFSRTQRIERSSSTIQTGLMPALTGTVSSVFIADTPRSPRGFERQKNREHRVAWNALTFDGSVVLSDECLRDREPETAAAFAARNEWVEDALADAVR